MGLHPYPLYLNIFWSNTFIRETLYPKDSGRTRVSNDMKVIGQITTKKVILGAKMLCSYGTNTARPSMFMLQFPFAPSKST